MDVKQCCESPIRTIRSTKPSSITALFYIFYGRNKQDKSQASKVSYFYKTFSSWPSIDPKYLQLWIQLVNGRIKAVPFSCFIQFHSPLKEAVDKISNAYSICIYTFSQETDSRAVIKITQFWTQLVKQILHSLSFRINNNCMRHSQWKEWPCIQWWNKVDQI